MVSTSVPQSGTKWSLGPAFGGTDAKSDCMYTAYILRSEQDGSYYKGSCKDLDRRLKQHNRGAVRSTKGKRPWVAHYSEDFDTKTEALKRERFLKSRSGYRWLRDQDIIEVRRGG